MFSALITKTLTGIARYTSRNNKQVDLLNAENCVNSEGLDNMSNNNNNNGKNNEDLLGSIFDCIRTIKDPEKPATLEDLQVVYEHGIKVAKNKDGQGYVVEIEFNPTVPHCTLATLIGLCMRIKVERNHLEKIKLDIHIKKGAHDTEDEINKQINDKERVAAAMENPNLRDMVEKCISEDD